MEQKRLEFLAWALAAAFLLVGQGCGSAGFDPELEPGIDDVVNPDPDTVVTPDPEDDAELADVSEMEAELVLLSGYTEHRIWGTSDDDLYLLGEDDLLVHFDGERWTPIEVDVETYYGDLTAVFGFSSTDVYLAGSGAGGPILRYDGEGFTEMEMPWHYSIPDIWGSAPDDMFAVSRSRVFHYDGDAWSLVETGLPANVRWYSISGSGPGNLVMVGRQGESPFESVFAHFDGDAWTEIDIPVDARLTEVWSAGPSTAFVVGAQGTILRFDGTSLTAMPSGTGASLKALWGTSAGEVFAGGEGVFLRFNGATWSQMEAPEGGEEGENARVNQIFGFGGSNVIAVGSGVHRFDGASWDTMLPFASYIENLWASSPSNVLMLGSSTHRFDGVSLQLEDFGSPDIPHLRAAWGAADRIFAVGHGGNIFLYDGEHWGRMTSNSTTTFFDVFGTSEDDVYAVGYDGTILHFDGVAWGGMISGTDAILRGVWAAAPDDVYVVGYEGTILHYDGDDWSPMDSGIDSLVWHITGFDSENLVAPSSSGQLLLGNGLTWRGEAVTVEDRDRYIAHLSGTSPDNMFAMGNDGLFHYDGDSWTQVSPLRPGGYEKVLAVGPRELYVSGRHGVYHVAPRAR